MRAVILAGGYATRLKSVTNNGAVAKPLLPITVDGKTQPILYFILDKLNEIVDYLDEIIVISNEKYLSQFKEACKTYSADNNVDIITVLSDGTTCPENARGANGTLKMVNDYIHSKDENYDDEVLVLAGDNYFDFSLLDLVWFYDNDHYINERYKPGESLNVVVSKVYPESDKEYIADKFGIINADENALVLSLDEKPGIENIKSTNVCLAIYMFDRKSFDLIDDYMKANETDKKKRDSLGYFINYIINNTNTYTFTFDGKFIDIGSPQDYYSMYNPNNKNNNL